MSPPLIQPSVPLPAGYAEREGAMLPVGVQLQANAFEEERLLRAARMLERGMADLDHSALLLAIDPDATRD